MRNVRFYLCFLHDRLVPKYQCPNHKDRSYNCTWKEVDGTNSFFPDMIYRMLVFANHTKLGASRTINSEIEVVNTKFIGTTSSR